MPPKANKVPDIIAVELKGNKDIKGGMASSRVKLDVKLEDGNIYPGYYTENTYADFDNQYLDLIDKTISKVQNLSPNNDRGIELLEKLKGKDLDFLFKLTYSAIGKAYTFKEAKNKNLFLPGKLTNKFVDILFEKDKNVDKNGYKSAFDDVTFCGIMQGFADDVLSLGAKNRINMKQVNLEKGGNINRRNNAMYEVSKLLGHEDLICQSVKMTTIENGVQKEGTFMVNAQGEDIKNIRPLTEKKYGPVQLVFSAEAKRDLSRLQVLDYLCGNQDRHIENMFYKMELQERPDGQGHQYVITGYQGIDNDSSFGQLKGDGNNTTFWMSNIDDIKVIDRAQRDHIIAMQPEAFEVEMRKIGLGAKEIEAGMHRLSQLRDRLKHNKIRVVEDLDAWNELDRKTLITINKNNQHLNIWGVSCGLEGRLNKEKSITVDEYLKKVNNEPQPTHVVESKNESTRLLFKSQLAGLREAKEAFSKTNPEVGTPEFKKMYNGIDHLIQKLETVSEIKEEDMRDKHFNLLSEEYDQEYKNIQEYISKKSKNPFTANGKARLHAAKNLAVQLFDGRHKVLEESTAAFNRKMRVKVEEAHQLQNDENNIINR